jgi:hypothetical protein
MSMDLVLQRGTDDTALDLIRPDTGEIIDLATADRDQIAGFFLAVNEWKRRADQAVKIASEAFAALSDRETTLSVVVDGYRVSVPGPGDVFVIDPDALRASLDALVADGTLSPTAANDACAPNTIACPDCGSLVPTGGYKVSKRALNALRKQPKLAAIIDACGEHVTPTQRPLKAERA